MDRNDHHIPGLPHPPRPLADRVGVFFSAPDEGHPGAFGCRPAVRHAAGDRTHRPDQDSMAAGGEHAGRHACCSSHPAPTGPRSARVSTSSVPEAVVAEVQHVVVGERAGVEPGSGQAPNILRVHPVHHGLRGLESSLLVMLVSRLTMPCPAPARRGLSASPQGREVHPLGDRPYAASAKSNVLPCVAAYCSNRRGSPPREDLIHTPARHHVPGQAQHDHTPLLWHSPAAQGC